MSTPQDKKHQELYSSRRIESLTDGVFAIAMTLLVLNLNVPKLVGAITDENLWKALVADSTYFFSFALSFAILGLMWSIHMRQFESIERVDKRATALNTLRLFIVVLIPFTTSLNAQYSNLLLAQMLYPLNLFFLALVTYLQGLYASNHRSFYRQYDQNNINAGQARSMVFVLATALVCILTVFVGNSAFFILILIPFIGRLVSKKYKK
jgi:uncharacterized membrane protein